MLVELFGGARVGCHRHGAHPVVERDHARHHRLRERGAAHVPAGGGGLFGANVGTTSTGWLVAVRLAVAGFGLLFLGIDTLQGGMEGLAERLDPTSLPGAGWAGRLLLVLVGAAMTVVLQSVPSPYSIRAFGGRLERERISRGVPRPGDPADRLGPI